MDRRSRAVRDPDDGQSHGGPKRGSKRMTGKYSTDKYQISRERGEGQNSGPER